MKASLNASNLKLQVKQKARVLKLKESSVAGDRIVSWSSSNPKIVSVNSKTGKMTGKKTGTAVITATLASKGQAVCRITVIKKRVATKKFSLSKKTVTLKKGKKYQIKLKKRLPLTANDKITYRSGNRKVASVTAKGKVTARAKGGTWITVRTAGRLKKKLKVTVK